MLKDAVTMEKSSFEKDVHTELRCQINKKRSVGILSGNLTSNGRSEESGVCSRVYKNGVWGFASMAETTKDAASKVRMAAAENADFMAKHAGRGEKNIAKIGEDKISMNCDIADPEQKVYIDFAREIDSYIEKKYPNLAARGITVYTDCMEKYLSVSDGADGHTVLPRSYVYVRLTDESKLGGPVDLFEPYGGFGSFDKVFSTPDKLYGNIDRLYEQLMQKKEGVYASPGIKQCILGGCLSGMLSHEAVGHTVEADLVLGGSVAAHSLNREVASPLVTMIDYANTIDGKEAPLPIYLDDEGVPCKDEVIIKDGILVGYLNNRETAEHFNMKAGGNARAYSFSDEPLIRMRNTGIVPGKSKLEDMIASVEDGYYFTDTNNGQADTTGEFMFGICMGYEIKNGKLGKALLDTTISGVAFEMLKTVDMVSDECIWVSSGFCGKKQPMPVGMGGPALRCKVNVGGR